VLSHPNGLHFLGFTKQDPVGSLFYALWITVLIYFAYNIFKSCLSRLNHPRPSAAHSGRPPRPPSSGWGSGWTGAHHDNDNDYHTGPPPPYPKPPSDNNNWWRSNFWTGLGLGAAGQYLWNRYNQPRQEPPIIRRTPYDWETMRNPSSGWAFETNRADDRDTNFRQQRHWQARGEGEGSSSNLGNMRRSTGVGGSVVR
jgi:hypothetical protein